MEVSGVRNSWVTESSNADRSCSLSREASARLSFSTAPARSIEIAIRLLMASRVSRESNAPETPMLPTTRSPMRRGITTMRFSGLVIGSPRMHTNCRSWRSRS